LHELFARPLPNRNPGVVLKWKMFNPKPHFKYDKLKIHFNYFLYNIDIKYN
jgi:hypothetical protein